MIGRSRQHRVHSNKLSRLRLPWYKRDHRKMLAMYRRLGFELGGAFSAIIDLCCLEGGWLEDDDRYISGQLGLDIRKWKRFKAALMTSGELYEAHDPCTGLPALSSLVADRIIQDGKKLVADSRRAGRISAARRAEKRAELEGASPLAVRDLLEEEGPIYRTKMRELNDLRYTPVERLLNDHRDKSRKENRGRSGADAIGGIIDQIDNPILQAASRAKGGSTPK